jgi:hypothetical protein
MTLPQITITLILRLIDGAKRILGDDAIKIANNIKGLNVNPNGEVVITGDGLQLLKQLLKQYEEAVQGEIILDLDVRVNFRKYVNNTEGNG